MDDFVLGECPEVSMPQVVSQIDWLQAELAKANQTIEALRIELDTARVWQNRKGW